MSGYPYQNIKGIVSERLDRLELDWLKKCSVLLSTLTQVQYFHFLRDTSTPQQFRMKYTCFCLSYQSEYFLATGCEDGSTEALLCILIISSTFRLVIVLLIAKQMTLI